MGQFTKKILVNGSGAVTLLSAMRIAGYTGPPSAQSIAFFNSSGVTLAYLHFTNDGLNVPPVGTEGWPLGTAAGGAGSTFFVERASPGQLIDLATTWLVSSGDTFQILVAVIGG